MMDQELEEKRGILKLLDPEACERADAAYRQNIDDALRQERRAFEDTWYALEEQHGLFVYPYLRDEFKAWLDEREEGN